MLRTNVEAGNATSFHFIIRIRRRSPAALVLVALLYGPLLTRAQPPASPQVYAYCDKPAGYYPAVQRCQVPWRQIPIDASKAPTQPSPYELPPGVLAPSAGQAATTTTPPHESHSSQVSQPQNNQVTHETQSKLAAERSSSPPPSTTKPASQPKPPVPLSKPPAPQYLSLSEKDVASSAFPILFFLMALAPLYLASRKRQGEDPNDAFTKALRRRANRRTYATVVVGISLILLVSAPGGGGYFLAGIAVAALVMMFYGRGRIDSGNFETTSDFFEALRHFGQLKALQHFNHGEDVTCHATNNFKGMIAPHQMLVIDSPSRTLWLTPARYWMAIGSNCSMGETRSISASSFLYREKTGSPRKGDTIHGETWQYATKSGDRDHRYKDNYQVYEVERYGLEIHFRNDLKWQIGGMQKPTSDVTLTAFNTLLGRKTQHSNYQSNGRQEENNKKDRTNRREEAPPPKQPARRPWYVVLEIEKGASKAQVVAARNNLVRQYHPDRIKGVEGLGPEFEKLANDKLVEINAAYEEAISSISKA